MRLIIIGPMASGKSVVGKKLSKRLDIDFYDTDEEIVKKTGVTISHIFDIEGEDKFRSREMNIFSDLIKKDDCVISTGGGIVLKQENRELLKKGTVLYLKTSIQTQLERTMNDKERPLLRGKENKELTLRKMAKLRNPLYEKSSNYIIEETDNSNQTVDNIIKQLNESK
jgi:shikimate kinase